MESYTSMVMQVSCPAQAIRSTTMNATTFRTAVVRTPGGPDTIEIIDVPVAEPGPGEVRVRVAAAPVNPVDLGVASGFFHSLGLINQPEHTGLGWDFAGTVDAAGPGVDLTVGTRVAGLVVGFDRNFGTYAEQLVVPAADLAVVPDALGLVAASTVPLNGLAAAQIVDLLGEPPADGRLLVTGAAGAVGGYVTSLAQDRGWRVTGLARTQDEAFVRGLGADFTTRPEPGWDGVADAGAVQEDGLALVRDGGVFVGVRPNAVQTPERGITVTVVVTHPDGPRLRDLLARTAAGQLPARIYSVLPLEQAADAHRAMAKGGVRGRYVLQP
jgi:NADPH:quinone reductase-like Zn-dependent oxidoreductase